MKRTLIITVALAVMAVAPGAAAVLNVPGDAATIEGAIALANTGDTILVADATYTPAGTLVVDKSLTLTGNSEGGVVIDASGGAGYGIRVSAADVTLENFTLLPPTPNYPIHASGTGNPPDGLDNLTLRHITITGAHQRTAFDVHGYNHVVLSHLTSGDATDGNGVQVTGCTDVAMDNITTFSNQWGSIAVYCSGPTYLNRPSSDVVIDGASCSLGENQLYQQDEFGLVSTNVSVTGYGFHVSNQNAAPGYGWFFATQAEALAAVAPFSGIPGTVIASLTGGPFVVAPGMLIQDAIDAADPYDAIDVLAGLYEEQLVINKDGLSLAGAGAGNTVIESPTNLVAGYSTGGIPNYPVIYVYDADGVGLKDLTVDGLGHGNLNYIFHGIAYLDAGGSLTGVDVTGMQDTPLSSTESGLGVTVDIYDGGPHVMIMTDVDVAVFQRTGVFCAGDGLDVTLNNVTITGDGATPTPKQNGLEIAWGATGVANGCKIQDLDYIGSAYTAVGALGYNGDTFRLVDCDFDAVQTSVYYEDMSLEMNGCAITDPTYDGVYMISNGAKASGDDLLPRRDALPYQNREGVAKADRAPVSLLIEHTDVVGVGLAASWGVTCWGAGPVDMTMNDCLVTDWDVGLAYYDLGADAITSTVRDSRLHGNAVYGAWTNGTVDQDCRWNWWGHYTGPLHPLTNPTALGVEISDHILYDPWSGTAGITVTPPTSGPVNCSTPVTLQFHYEPDTPYSPPLRGYEITFSATGLTFGSGDIADSGGLGAIGTHAFYVVDNGDGTFTANDGLLGTTPGLLVGADLFNVTVTATGTGTGEVVIHSVKLRDLSNIDFFSTATGALVTADCTPPPPVEDIAARTEHAEVVVSWTIPTEADVDHYLIYRSLWYDGDAPYASAYPEYDDLANDLEPARPASHGSLDTNVWTYVGTVTSGTFEFSDLFAPRGIYYYEVFAVDALGNVSDPAAANDRAANYWLGDLEAMDGDVDLDDVTVFGATYGLGHGQINYNNEADIGPTDDGTGLGFPLTDSVVDFEDLMIVAQNYGEVSKRQPGDDDAIVNVAWRRNDDGSWSLILVDPCAGLKGLRVNAALPEGIACSVEPGSLLDAQSLPAFVGNIDAHGLDCGVALLGNGMAIQGQGELLKVVPSEEIDELGATVTARGRDNTEIRVEASSDAGDVPGALALGRNYPNPFNPSTSISYDLPAAADVRLSVYSLDGRLLREVVRETVPAGRHTAVWDGRDGSGRSAPSGTYVFRLEAAGQLLMRKAMLMK